MSRDTSSTIYLRFAVASFAAIVLIVGGFGFIDAQLVRRSNERSAAQSAASIVGAPLRPLFDSLAQGSPVPDDVRAAAEDAIEPLVGSDVHAIRVWGEGEQPIVEAGAGATGGRAGVPAGGLAWKRANTPDGGRLFVTFAPAGNYTIEVAQSPAAVNDAIASANRDLITLLVLFAAACFALVQVTFWFGVRRFAAGHRRLLHLYTRGDEIRSSLDLHEVVTHLSRDATLLARGSHGFIALYDEATGDVMLRATYEHATGAVAHHQRAVEEWFLRRCVATNTTVMTSQPATAYRQFLGPAAGDGKEMASVCVPVSLRERVVGVVTVVRPADRRRGGKFTASEVQGIEELAGQAVTAVEQALLFAKVRSYADEIELSYDATLKALMAALDAKDEVTEGHCERVARLTLHLARDMGVPEQQLIDIERGALLHDVGKIGVPDAVLRKPKELNDGEWEAMRKHPLLAGLMVSKIGFLEGALPILLYHHERYDGTGYPFGLTGDKIPVEARIFSIIDAYDAMTSQRPYRDAMSHEAAMAEVAANSGLQFDPEVVEAFERLMNERPDLQHHGSHQLPADHDEHDHEAAAAAEDAA